MTSHISTAENDGYAVPRWGPYPSETPQEAKTRRFCTIEYALVCIYIGQFEKRSRLEGHLTTGDNLLKIKAYPPDENDRANDQSRDDIHYSYGDPGEWACFLSASAGSGSVDNPHNFEMMITEGDFIKETSNHEGPRTVALEALRMLDDESNFIVKDASGDAVLDDNGNKLLFVKFDDRGNQPWEPWVFHFKRVVHGQETIFTEREKKRVGLYLAGEYDG